MFTKKPAPEKSGLDKAIDDLLVQMTYVSPDSKAYSKMTSNLTKLYALRDDKSKKSISPDTVAVVAGNLLGIAMIVGHEKVGVVTSKALQFVMKAK